MKRFCRIMISLLLAVTLLAGCTNISIQEGTGTQATESTTASKPVEPQPTESKPVEPQPTESKPTEPQPTEPKPTEPQPTEPKPTEPQPTEPKPTEPQPTVPEQPKDPAVQPPAVGSGVGLFEDAAFIGDSVTLKLRNYNIATGALGNPTFLCQGSYSVYHAVNNTMYLKYQGQDLTPQDALKACGAKKVFLLLGLNDIDLCGISATIQSWGKLVSNIRAVNPDIQIFIQSGTPIYTGGEKGGLNNA